MATNHKVGGSTPSIPNPAAFGSPVSRRSAANPKLATCSFARRAKQSRALRALRQRQKAEGLPLNRSSGIGLSGGLFGWKGTQQSTSRRSKFEKHQFPTPTWALDPRRSPSASKDGRNASPPGPGAPRRAEGLPLEI